MQEDQATPRPPNQVDRLLLREEVRSIVVRAALAGGTLQVGQHAKRLSESHGAAGLSPKSIADDLILTAASAGVPIEMDRCD